MRGDNTGTADTAGTTNEFKAEAGRVVVLVASGGGAAISSTGFDTGEEGGGNAIAFCVGCSRIG
jgi:hypothetical protein